MIQIYKRYVIRLWKGVDLLIEISILNCTDSVILNEFYKFSISLVFYDCKNENENTKFNALIIINKFKLLLKFS